MDIIFAVPSGPAAIDFAVQLVSRWWPNRVFAMDHDAGLVTRYDQLVFHDRSEVIVYRDMAASDAWDEIGYDDSLKGTMVYLLCSPTQFTLVTEHDPCAETVALTNAIAAGLATAFSAIPDREAA